MERMLEPFVVSTNEGNGTAKLIPAVERREANGPGGEKQVCHLVPFELVVAGKARRIRLAIPDSLLRVTRTERGTLLDDEQLLARLLQCRLKDAPAGLQELEVGLNHVRAVARIAVGGSRVSAADWRAASGIPKEELPALTKEQRHLAERLNVSAEDYARSMLANQLGMKMLLAKTDQFARLLAEKVRAVEPKATVEHVTLKTGEHSFEAQVRSDGVSVPLRVAEDVVDDLFERGSAEAEKRLQKIVDLAFQLRSAR
jgi:hypothetical protein